MNIAIIFAGGKGTRMGSEIPKQFLEINGKPILVHTLELFQNNTKIDKIYISTLGEYISYVKELSNKYQINKVIDVVEGGETAQDSIYKALKRAEQDNPGDSIVLLHDGVRPYVHANIIDENIEAVEKYGSAITSIPAYETIMISKDASNVESATTRNETYIGQAPQSFYLKEILEAHDIIRKLPTRYENMVDACTIYKTLGKDVHLVKGNRGNLKITTPEDVYIFKAFLEFKENKQTFDII